MFVQCGALARQNGGPAPALCACQLRFALIFLDTFFIKEKSIERKFDLFFQSVIMKKNGF